MEIDIHISLTTQAIMVLSCYFTMFALAVLLVWILKLNIQSTCCFAFLIFIGTVVIGVVGFAGLAFQLQSDLQSECAARHHDYVIMTSYAYCQINYAENQLNNSVRYQLSGKVNKYFRTMREAIPPKCPVRDIYTDECGGRRTMSVPNTTDFNMRLFGELSRLPLCDAGDTTHVCNGKKEVLVDKLTQALDL